MSLYLLRLEQHRNAYCFLLETERGEPEGVFEHFMSLDHHWVLRLHFFHVGDDGRMTPDETSRRRRVYCPWALHLPAVDGKSLTALERLLASLFTRCLFPGVALIASACPHGVTIHGFLSLIRPRNNIKHRTLYTQQRPRQRVNESWSNTAGISGRERRSWHNPELRSVPTER